MLLWVNVGILLSVGYLAHGEDKSCPSNISPCYCIRLKEENKLNKFVICDSIKNLAELYPVLNQTEGLDVSFEIEVSKIQEIPSDLFQGQKSKVVKFYENRIQSFGSRPFSGLEDYLEELSIRESVRNDVSIPIAHLKKLRRFEFKENANLKKLGNEWFGDGPATLKYVEVYENGFEGIGDRVFADLINVEKIFMGGNKFQDVSRSMFPRPAKELHTLDMSYNMIRDLPKDIFDDMPQLLHLKVSGNKLATISEAVFGRIYGYLHSFRFERNEGLVCDHRMEWLRTTRRMFVRPSFLEGDCGPGESLRDFLRKWIELPHSFLM